MIHDNPTGPCACGAWDCSKGEPMKKDKLKLLIQQAVSEALAADKKERAIAEDHKQEANTMVWLNQMMALGNRQAARRRGSR